MPLNFTLCTNCPYYNNNHLGSPPAVITNPLSLENNSSQTLLVFQAPGFFEWTNNKPISSTNSHSCAVRMSNSFSRKRVFRSNYDITEACQCYPGKNKSRDKKPSSKALSCCLKFLILDIQHNFKYPYNVIVCFGVYAFIQVKKALLNIQTINITYNPIVKFCPHPSSNISNAILDNCY